MPRPNRAMSLAQTEPKATDAQKLAYRLFKIITQSKYYEHFPVILG
jgi:hypothetical protein